MKCVKISDSLFIINNRFEIGFHPEYSYVFVFDKLIIKSYYFDFKLLVNSKFKVRSAISHEIIENPFDVEITNAIVKLTKYYNSPFA